MSSFDLHGNVSAPEVTEPLQVGGLVCHVMISQSLTLTIAFRRHGALAGSQLFFIKLSPCLFSTMCHILCELL